MNFKQRLFRYLVGFGIGLILVYVFFKDRNVTGWLPENRVKDQINDSRLIFSDKATCYIKCLKLSPGWVEEFLKEANVKFKESDTRKEPCPEYIINGTLDGKTASVVIESCQAESNVVNINLADNLCECQ